MSRRLLIALAAMIMGCTSSSPAVPADAFRDFHAVVQAGDIASIEALLSSSTRAEIDLAAANGTRTKEQYLSSLKSFLPETIQSIEDRTTPPNPDAALLTVVGNNGIFQVEMIREDGGWRFKTAIRQHLHGE